MGCAYPGSIPVLPLLQVFQVSLTGLGVSSVRADLRGDRFRGFFKRGASQTRGWGSPAKEQGGGYPRQRNRARITGGALR